MANEQNPSPTPQSRVKAPGQESPFSRSLTLVGLEAEADNIQATVEVPLDPLTDAGKRHYTFRLHRDDLQSLALDLLKQFEKPKTKKSR